MTLLGTSTALGSVIQGTPNTPANAWPHRLVDGVSTAVATVAAFHNADNQALPANSYGLNTGGVAQLLNSLGNIDRQRETGLDGVSNVGIATGTQQLAVPFVTNTGAAAIVAGTRTVTPAAMSGAVRGSTWVIQTGHILSVDTGANQEYVFVSATTATTFTAVFAKAHAAAVVLSGFIYNQARDASILDGSLPGGLAASMTYLLNQNANSTNGGIESERSFTGELDGATGVGAAIACEYEYNSGGPILASGLASGLRLDAGRNAQGKGQLTAAVTATVAGTSSVTFPSAAATNLVQPGAPLYLAIGTGPVVEVVYVTGTWVPGSAALVPIVVPVVTAGSTQARFDSYAPAGPGLNPILPTGVEVSEELVWSPNAVPAAYYQERAADGDAMAVNNIGAGSAVLFTGAAMDRARSLQGLATTAAIGRESAHPGLPVLASLSAVSAVTNGSAMDCVVAHQTAALYITQTSTTAPTTLTVQLQFSADNVNWVSAGQSTATVNGTYVVNVTGFPFRYARGAVTVLTGGAAVSVTTTIAVAA